MSNPVLSERIFKQSRTENYSGAMTINGTLTKALMMLVLAFAGAAYTWKIFYTAINPASVMPWMWGGMIGGFITAMIISFKPASSPYLAPVYALCEGFFLGAISATFNSAFTETAPNIVVNAVMITFLSAFVMFLIYRTNIIKVNGTFARIMTVAVGAIALFYFITLIASLFGANLSFMTGSSPLSIAISIVIAGVAAFSLLMDYKFIEEASYAGVPKYMEWYGAFGLMVTLVWLYLEILKLLAKFAGNRE